MSEIRKPSFLAYPILFFIASTVLLVATDFFLQWYMKIPSKFLKEIVHFDPALVPAKRVQPNLNETFIGAYREFKFHVASTSDGFRKTEPDQINEGEDPEIITLGDSQTFGIGMDNHETIASFISQKTRKPVLN